jgi:hypothetical protein
MRLAGCPTFAATLQFQHLVAFPSRVPSCQALIGFGAAEQPVLGLRKPVGRHSRPYSPAAPSAAACGGRCRGQIGPLSSSPGSSARPATIVLATRGGGGRWRAAPFPTSYVYVCVCA